VTAVNASGVTQFTLSWVSSCLEDPQADNVVFKFAGALKDFGEDQRAATLYADLQQYESYRAGTHER
jgi:hypothetical protein